MKFLLLTIITLSIIGCANENNIKLDNHTKKLSFNNIWNTVSDKPLKKLPQNNISFNKLYKNHEDIISKDAKRTLEDKNDILKSFDKLAHPNGICFKGIWHIQEKNIYSGYFKQNTKALIIARASTALSNTKNTDLRAFGFAGKIFPTTNPNKINKSTSANFFLIEDLGGTNAKYFTAVELSNEPKISLTSAVLKNLLYTIKVTHSFNNADKNPTIRQLYEVSNLEENNNNYIITPKWMKIKANTINKNNAIDFREELKIQNGEKLVFNISVANTIIKKKKNWKEIGTITFDTSVISNACDHNLHFHHPKNRDDLNYK